MRKTTELILTDNTNKEEIVLEGIAASPGIAHGNALVYLRKELDVPSYAIDENEIESEIERFDQAMLETRQQISKIRNNIAESLGEGEAQIFDAHLMVLEDCALIDGVTNEIRNDRKNIEFCFNKVSQQYIDFFNSMEDEYLRERVTDIRDVSRRVLHNLMGMQKIDLAHIMGDQVLVAVELTPSDTADIERNKLLGLVTDAGSRTSHTVIMARSLQIPAVVGMHDATEKIHSGDQILVDGFDGIVIINPTESRLFQYGKLATVRIKLNEVYKTALDKPSETKDGKPVALMANIDGSHDMDHSLAKYADGVGLFRTEVLFLRNKGYPSVKIQYNAYTDVVKAAGDKPVIIRTLDLGGDKSIDAGKIKEENPFMGLRAIRFCLEYVDVFKTQLRAILMASAHGNIKILYPMISGLGELIAANEILESVKVDMRKNGEAFDETVEVGSMIELPSAACIVDLIAKESDFLSIGSNDLIQYLLAVDRLNDRVAHLYEPAHPAVLRTIKSIIDTGNAANTPVSICGEIAGDPLFIGLLIGMGVSSLSFASSTLPEVKYLLRRIQVDAAKELVDEVLSINNPKNVLTVLEKFRFDAMGDPLREKN